VDQARHAMMPCRQRNSAGAFDVNGAISLCARLGQNADEIDDGIRSRDCTADGDVVKHIGLDELRVLGAIPSSSEHGQDGVRPGAPSRHFGEAAPPDGDR
jgi:hypothetical protein